MTDAPEKPRRGRPKGSKNKTKNATSAKRRTRRRSTDTIAAIIRGGLISGKAPEAIIADVKKAYPQAKTSAATINNYRSQLRKQGAEIPTVRRKRASAAAAKNTRKAAKSPRKRTITDVIRTALLAGKTNDEAIEAVKKEFPDAKTSRNTVVIQRSKLRKEGKRLPGSWEARKKAAAAVPASVNAPQKGAEKAVAIASDHAGAELKNALKKTLRELGLKAIDLGTKGKASVDYPDYADAVAKTIAEGKATRGVVICGSGVGISIAANRHKHLRAALCTSGMMAELARRHNDANVLALGARLVGEDVAKDCLVRFMQTEFEGGRHARRVKKMS